MDVLIVIPARYASSRFPGKPLALLKGVGGAKKSLVQRTWEVASSVSHRPMRAVVATDDFRILAEVERFGGDVVLTSSACRNGTERCAEVVKQLDTEFDVVVNLQGDAPLTPPRIIDELLAHLREADETTGVATPVIRSDANSFSSLMEDRDAGRIGATTAVFDKFGRGLYFSKEILPKIPPGLVTSSEGGDPPLVYHHIGVYAYRLSALERYSTAEPGRLERLEGLEQLRFLEEGISIDCVEVRLRRGFWEVNNPGDIPKVESLLESRGIK